MIQTFGFLGAGPNDHFCGPRGSQWSSRKVASAGGRCHVTGREDGIYVFFLVYVFFLGSLVFFCVLLGVS